MSGKFNDEAAQKSIMESLQSKADFLVYNFKYLLLMKWNEVTFEKVFGAISSVGEMSMLSGDIVTEVDPAELLPSANINLD
jgi:hypothetical protein